VGASILPVPDPESDGLVLVDRLLDEVHPAGIKLGLQLLEDVVLDHPATEFLADLAQHLLGVALASHADRGLPPRVAGERGLNPIPDHSDALVAAQGTQDDLAARDLQIDPLGSLCVLGRVRAGQGLVDHGKAEGGGGGGDSGSEGGPGCDNDRGEDGDGTHGLSGFNWTGTGWDAHGEILGMRRCGDTEERSRCVQGASRGAPLDDLRFAIQSEGMDDALAAENLRVIRTLMERSAVYRRALAPVSLATGGLGLASGATGWFLRLDTVAGFVGFWMAAAVIASGMSLGIVRRQALGDREAFWSPPTRRVAEALLPPLLVGLVSGVVVLLGGGNLQGLVWWLPAVWMVLYGCAIHAAGFFVPRGMRRLGWIFIGSGCALPLLIDLGPFTGKIPPLSEAHLIMAAAFGGLHMAYGIYLSITEKRKSVA